tara:strand:- start:14 stop:685 length:672 start_codon:yes stop_codon:yes gene_type:complete
MKKIGILGGMGPEATAELYLKIIRIFQKKYGAKYDDDFPEIVIINLPIPDIVESLTAESKVKAMLIDGIQRLENAGVDFIAIPCNTVTKYLEEMEEAVSIPIINIVEETIKVTSDIDKVGLLGTESTINNNLYSELRKKVLLPSLEQQQVTTKIIMGVLSGVKSEIDKFELKVISDDLISRGAEKVILGCTELPLIVSGGEFIDTIEVLAEAIVEKATSGGEK